MIVFVCYGELNYKLYIKLIAKEFKKLLNYNYFEEATDGIFRKIY